jgi:hypothetical protein
MDALTPERNQQCFDSLIEHWAEARIDGPMQALARYDDAAKYLITIGGFLQGGLFAVYSVLDKQGRLLGNRWQIAFVILFEFSLVGFISLAAWACSLQPEMHAKGISNLLTQALRQCISETDLTKEVKSWCVDVENKIRRKKGLMLAAKILYILSILTMPGLLLFPLMR